VEDQNFQDLFGGKFWIFFPIWPIPAASHSKVWNCRRSLAGIAASNPAGGFDICLL
jgi:hypothetical protein